MRRFNSMQGKNLLLRIPIDILSNYLFGYFSFRDLQNLNVAFQASVACRAILYDLWRHFLYVTPSGKCLCVGHLKWMRQAGLQATALNIIVINISRDSNFAKCMECIVGYSSLKHLVITDVAVAHIDNGHRMMQLVMTFPKLETLRLNNVVSVTNTSVLHMCRYCIHLRDIGLHDGNMLNGAAFGAIGAAYPQLQKIDCMFDDDALISLSNKCHELRSVVISGAGVTQIGLSALWASNPKLIEVVWSSNTLVSNRDIEELLFHCPMLQNLCVSGSGAIDNMAMMSLAAQCPHLSSLDIASNQWISDAGAIALAESCRRLTSLNFSQCNITDSSLVAIGQHCHALEYIFLGGCMKITNVSFMALGNGCPLLQEFNAIGTCITDEGLVAMAYGCRGLRVIHVTGCTSISFRSISVVASHCPLLSWLSVGECNIDDACLYALAEHSSNLIHLQIFGTNVSNDALVHLVASCPYLSNLVFGGCKRLSRLYLSWKLHKINPLICVSPFDDIVLPSHGILTWIYLCAVLMYFLYQYQMNHNST